MPTSTSITAFSDLYPLMEPDLPACPEPFILQALKKTARKFASETDGWRQWLPSINIVAQQRDYLLTAPTDTEIRHVLKVCLNTADAIAAGYTGVPVHEKAYDYYAEASTRLGSAIAAHTLSFSYQHIPSVSVTGGLDVAVSLLPVYNAATVVNADFLERWHEAIVGGAMYSLMTMPKRKWTDKQRALDFQKDYFRGINRLRRENIADYKGEVPCLEA